MGCRGPPSIYRWVEVYADLAETEVDGRGAIITEGKISVSFWLKSGVVRGRVVVGGAEDVVAFKWQDD